MTRFGLVLKISVFATGCAGIVAEFVLSTLATYLIGNAVFQWTMVMSLMLFAMGVGSRLSKLLDRRLLESFIFIEFALSILCASSSVLAYGIAAYTSHISLLIYALAMLIGGLVGFEIPLVTRINEAHEELRSNIATIMEKDYYGALLGGLFFAFFALPHLGLTYTPIALGAVNFIIASILLWFFLHLVDRKKTMIAAFGGCLLFLGLLGTLAKPIILYGEQRRYRDKVIMARQTPYQKIVMTQWKNHYWLFINGQEQFSTFDEEKYHEPLVHPAMALSADRSRVLILGGGDGLALREVWKYPDVKTVTLVDLDPEMTDLGANYPIMVDINHASFSDPRVRVVNQDAAAFLRQDANLYGVIIVDLPDPDTIDLMHLYATSFYTMTARHLIAGGIMVTQATSPYFSPQAFWCIMKTVRSGGFTPLPYHNQVPTMGEWSWILGVKETESDEATLKRRLLSEDFDRLPTRFLNNGAVISMVHFGKGLLDSKRMEEIEVNTELNPVLHRYYGLGAWAMY
jgi:spermidine synthase